MKNNIPDFMSTLSTFPYLLKSLSTSDCRASKSRFPQKTGFIFEESELLRNPFAIDLHRNARKNELRDSKIVNWTKQRWRLEDRRRLKKELSRIWCSVEGSVPCWREGGCGDETLGWRFGGKLQNSRGRVMNALTHSPNTASYLHELWACDRLRIETHRFAKLTLNYFESVNE